jgi:hypothetical protein
MNDRNNEGAPRREEALDATQLVCAAALFSTFGLLVELTFTGVWAGLGESFRGHVSLLMIPVYTAAFLAIEPLMGILARLDWTAPRYRIPLTIIVIYAFEWVFGAGYEAVGLRPWHYEHGWASDFSGGHITLYYLPGWFVFAWMVLPAERMARALAPHAVDVVVDSGRPR